MGDKRKIALVGAGMVGMSMAYTIVNRGGVNELVLIDINKEKTIGEAMDLSHSVPFTPGKIQVRAGEYKDCRDADIVVITAGATQKDPNETRLDLAITNTKIMKEVTENVVQSGFNGIFIIATNPVDLMSYVVQKVSGFDTGKVIGTGTLLDTARLRYIIGQELDITSKNIHAYIMGEHGDSSFVPWSQAYVGCKSLVETYKEHGKAKRELDSIHKEVVNAGYEIIKKKKATYYGIGVALSRLIHAILENENSILPVSTFQNGEYGQNNIYIGVPAVITKKGVREILKLKLTESEQAKFDKSAIMLKEIMKNVIDRMIKE
jgi:L-lactate dehydrogenase